MKIKIMFKHNSPIKVEQIHRNKFGECELVISDDEDINFYETNMNMNDDDNIYKEFEIGDYAKVIGKTAWGFIKKGEIVRIDDSLGNGRYKIKLIDKPGYDYAEATALDLISDKVLNDYLAEENNNVENIDITTQSKVNKYRKKSTIVKAVQYNGFNVREIVKFTKGKAKLDENGKIVIQAVVGNYFADIGDWIVKEENGEFYLYKDDVFIANYEKLIK